MLVFTWLPNPTPAPRKSLPKMSMARFTAQAVRMTPARKNNDASCMVSFRPYLLQHFDAKRLQTTAAR